MAEAGSKADEAVTESASMADEVMDDAESMAEEVHFFSSSALTMAISCCSLQRMIFTLPVSLLAPVLARRVSDVQH